MFLTPVFMQKEGIIMKFINQLVNLLIILVMFLIVLLLCYIITDLDLWSVL
jgi:hypothetical protein